MKKIVAIFEVDEEKLNEVEAGGPDGAFGWLEDSGLYYQDYQWYEEGERLPDITNYHPRPEVNSKKQYWAVLAEAPKRGNKIHVQIEYFPHYADSMPPLETFEDEYSVYKRKWFESEEEAEAEVEELRSLNFSIERKRISATQGSVSLFVDGEYLLNFNDNIEFVEQGKEYYGDNVGFWASTEPDGKFLLGIVWHNLEHIYNYRELARNILKNKELEEQEK